MKIYNLDNDPKINSGFNVPEDYFESFTVRLPENTIENNTKLISIFSTRKLIYAVAAIFVMTCSIAFIYQYFNRSNEIENLALDNYIANFAVLNDNDFADLLTDNDIEKLKIDLNLGKKNIEFELYHNENLEEYLTN